MKLTRSKLRRLIKEEVSRLVEMQVELGLPHEFSNEVLYQHVMNWISSNPGPIDYHSPEQEQAKSLLNILSNRIRELGVYHPDHHSFDYETYESTLTPGKTEEQKIQDKEMQGKLKMARYALARHIESAKYSGLSSARKDHYRR
jgi:hypothetical protein